MIQLVFAAALANSIVAAPGLWAHAQWAETRPNVQIVVENRSAAKAWLVDLACDAYDARGVRVATATGSLPELQPGERATTFAMAPDAAAAARFTCKVTVADWRTPGGK